MAVTQRKGKNPGPLAASAAAPKGSSKKKAGNVAKREPGTSGAAGAESNLGLPPLLRAALAAAALALSVSCAFVEWPIYTAYEKDLTRPAKMFARDLGITAVVALAVAASPPVRALKGAGAAPAGTAAEQPDRRTKKQGRRQTVAAFVLLLLSFYFGFGLWGPCGVLTATAVCAAFFLALP